MYQQFNKPLVSTFAMVLFVTACAHAESDPAERFTLDSVPEAASDLSGTVEAPAYGKGVARLVEMAKTDLAANLGIEPSDIKVSEAAFVTWRNSSIGCPAPDTAYMDVLTNGSRIVLKANNGTFHYHGAGNVPPTYCPKPSTEKPLPYAPGEA